MPKIHFNNKQCFYIGILFLFLSGLLFLVILLFHLKNFSKMEYLKDVRKSNVFAQMNASVMTDYFTRNRTQNLFYLG